MSSENSSIQPANNSSLAKITENKTNTGITVEKPIPLLQREIKPDFLKISQTVAKGGIDFFTGNWGGFAKDLVDLASSLGLKANSSEERAGLLIIKSISNAIQELVKNSYLFNYQPTNSKELTKKISELLAENPPTIDDKFFTHPENLPFLKNLQASFYQWLITVLENKKEAESIANRLPEYFANALFQEWKNNQDKYQVILVELDNPFKEAVKKQQEWCYYRAYLRKKVQESVFQEAFSLKEIYIPLRAFYEQKSEKENNNNYGERESEKCLRIVVNPQAELNNWLAKNDKDDAIRMVTGAPGGGKSSFGKMWAAELAKQGKNVLFIPLHRFNFEKDDILHSIQEYLSFADFFEENPVDKDNKDLNLLLIFDGLDELAKQGKIGEETAKNFVEDVKRLVDNFNFNKPRLQVLILGREVVIQANSGKFKHSEKLLYLLPYFITNKEKDQHKYQDNQNLLAQDQRQEWWQKYRKIKNKEYTGLPTELDRDNLIDITSQPLLNYLVVLSYEKGDIKFDENTNINQIYQDLLARVYERGYEEENRQHQAIEGISQDEFIRILREIAVSCWHGNGRTTTIKEIEKQCQNSNLKPLLEKFTKSLDTDKSVTVEGSINNLLWAFYFRQSEDLRGSEKTFEFSHKSFGEYLTATRLVNALKTIDNEFKHSQENYGSYNEEQALIEWLKLTGVSPLDFDIFPFICREMQLQKKEDVTAWQRRLCGLIEYVMVKGMPLEKITGLTFQQMLTYSKNSESTLLIVLNACARVTQELSVIDWKSTTNFGEWISRLIGQRENFEKLLVTDCLSYLDLHECDLRLRDFYQANFERANLERAHLVNVNLYEANLDYVNLKSTYLAQADLQSSELFGANLEEAHLQNANLRYANLEEANLEEANLEEANLQETRLDWANLKKANLEGTDCESASFEEANLQGANLENTNLGWGNFWGANLQDANFKGANLVRANLRGANLEGANFEGANFEGANLEGANLEGAYYIEGGISSGG